MAFMAQEYHDDGQPLRVVQIVAEPFEREIWVTRDGGELRTRVQRHHQLYALRSDGAIFCADTLTEPMTWLRAVGVPGCFEDEPTQENAGGTMGPEAVK